MLMQFTLHDSKITESLTMRFDLRAQLSTSAGFKVVNELIDTVLTFLAIRYFERGLAKIFICFRNLVSFCGNCYEKQKGSEISY